MEITLQSVKKGSRKDCVLTGGIAQLVERCFCTADVSGSSPLTSTTLSLQRKLSAFIKVSVYDVEGEVNSSIAIAW